MAVGIDPSPGFPVDQGVSRCQVGYFDLDEPRQRTVGVESTVDDPCEPTGGSCRHGDRMNGRLAAKRDQGSLRIDRQLDHGFQLELGSFGMSQPRNES